MNKAAIHVDAVHKSYRLGKQRLHVLRGVDCSIAEGQFATIVGASGSGKSTLLHLIGLLDRADSGQIGLGGVDVAGLSAGVRNMIRRRDVGFVFQFYHLFSELNVLENTMLPAMVDTPLLGWFSRRKARRTGAVELLEQIGMGHRLRHRPRELSGGERQRVAIARALMNRPKILLADEPTGNLDSKAGREIIALLKAYNREGQTILMVTHDSDIAASADRILHLVDGRMTEKL